MKRKIAVFLLCLLLCGCTAAREELRMPETQAENQAEPSKTPATHEPQHTNPTPEATELQAEAEPQTPGELAVPTQPPTPTKNPQSTQPSSTLPSTAEPTEPAPTESVPATESTETETPTESPTEPPTEPPFDIDAWVSFAREYAASLGLVLNSAATSCWDNPILASAQSRYLERDLKGVLEDYASALDITQVWIWSELRPDGRYDIYIGYA